jgi:RecB family endonuclease NucS
MSPTPEGTARAFKAWATIRSKAAEKANANAKSLEIAKLAESKARALEMLAWADAKKTALSLEYNLQRAFRENIEQLEKGLVIQNVGKEKFVLSGRMHFLAIDANKVLVVIELMVGTVEHEVISQILSYMGELQEENNGPVRGIVIARDFTARAIAASKPVANIELQKYGFSFSFKKM